jgi:hypothetical protein
MKSITTSSDAARVTPPLPPRLLSHVVGRRPRVGNGGAPGPPPVGVGAPLRRPRLQHLLAHVLRRRPRHAARGDSRPRRGRGRGAQRVPHLGVQRRRAPRAADQASLLRRGGLPGELLLLVHPMKCVAGRMPLLHRFIRLSLSILSCTCMSCIDALVEWSLLTSDQLLSCI